MRILIFILLVTFALSLEEKEEFPEENDVIVLTNTTLNKAIEKYEYLMVLFYAPWCGHCKQFKPEYEKAAAKLKKENYFLSKIDATAYPDLKKKYKITGFPTVKFFIKGGEPLDYRAGRKEDIIIQWIHRKVQVQTVPLSSIEEVDDFIEKFNISTIYFGSKKEDIEEFSKLSMKIEEFPFAIVNSSEVIKKYAKPGTVVLYKNFDEKKNEITTIKEKELQDFYDKYSVPKVMTFDAKGINSIFSKKHFGLIIFESEDSEKWKEYDKILHNIYDKVNGDVKLILTDIKEKRASRIAEHLGVTESNLPKVMIIDNKAKLLKYIMTDEINEKNLIKFVNDWKEKKISPFLKSQEEPKENNGDIFVLVGKSFEKEVIKNDKDVMVLFYAPWCGHCKKFHPVYEEVAKRLKPENPKLLFAKMDATENEVESVNIRGYPTIKFYPGNKKDQAPVDYKGDRSYEKVIEFIKTNAATPINYVETEEEKKKREEDKKKKEEDKKKKEENKKKKEENKKKGKTTDL